MKRHTYTYSLFLFALLLTIPVATTQSGQNKPVKEYKYKIEEVLPHNIGSYTQGFFYHNGYFYESTGQYGSSMMAKTDIPTGRILQSHALDRTYFGEGACVHNGLIYQLTWTEKTCFIYELSTLKLIATLRYNREGWGLTSNGTELIMSDGTSTLYFLDPDTFVDKRTLKVTRNGKPLANLNELEYINGKIWANIYTSDEIVLIDPQTGHVTGAINLKGILPVTLRTRTTDVLNGIAYDKETNSIWITGKYWPRVYRITIY
ncbi:MAG: glutaminyl-peptide cyclotransferase [Bacteroidales bacterium]|jgi:glutamine cyclotransferase